MPLQSPSCTYIWRKACSERIHTPPRVHCSTLYSSQDAEAAKMGLVRYTDKGVSQTHTYTNAYNAVLLSHKKRLFQPNGWT